MTHMAPDQARQYLRAYKADRTGYMPSYAVEALETIAAVAADTLEYGVARPDDEGWGIWWDDQRMQDWGTLDEARENLARVKRHCPDARLVARRVSEPWEVTE